MKVYLNKLKESWVVDRFRSDWYKNNLDVSTELINESEVIWIIAPWVWSKIPKKQLKQKKVICSIYHIDFDNFTERDKKDFYKRDAYVDEYHVISKKTLTQLELLTDKKIWCIPFWVDQNIWFYINEKEKLRKEFGFEDKDFLIGSFQRDTEGKDLKTPKMIKGPDIFLNIVKIIYQDNKNLRVILTGKRRNYLIERLQSLEIPFSYFEMVDLVQLNKLYNVLDLYLVTSRVEGGPQAIVECAISKTPILSTNVGISTEILHPKSIFEEKDFLEAKTDIEFAYNKVKNLTIPKGMEEYRRMLHKVYEN